MKKIKAFLDLSAIISYLAGNERLYKMFSSELMEKVEYFISFLIYQELLIAQSDSKGQLNFNKIKKSLNIGSPDPDKMTEYLKEIKQYKNAVHTNDFFVMGAAFSCDYLVTYDTDLQRLNVGDSIKVVSPERFLEIADCHT